jgi:biopolymer transport protein ExbD
MTVTATLAMADVPVNTPPTRDGPRVAPSVAPTPAPAPSLPPLVHLDADGVHVFAAGQRQAPGCRAVGASAVTVPRVGGAQDWLALRSCALELAADAPDQRVRLSATADAPYEDIVHAMDALRGTPAQPLFSDVQWIAATR